MTEPVIMEVVAGARTDDGETDLRRLLLRFHLLGCDVAAGIDAATGVCRRRRRVGVTPSGMIDCVIASFAQGHQATLLAAGVDLSRVADVVGIDLDEASARA